MDSDFQAMLDMMQGQQDNARAEREKLQAMVAAPSQEGFLNEGQGAMDLLLDPTERQRQSMMQMGLSMMGADPRQSVGQTISQGVGKGMSLMDSLREKDRARELQAQSLAVKDADTDYGYMKDMASMMPDPATPSWTNVQNPDGSTSFIDRTIAGHGASAGGAAAKPPSFTEHSVQVLQENGTWRSQKAYTSPEARGFTDVDGNLYPSGAVRADTKGETAADVASKKPTATQAHQITNSIQAMHAFDALDKLMDGDTAKQFQAIFLGSIPLPTEIGAIFKHSKSVATNVIGRLESGGQIRNDEMGKYESMLVPTVMDLLSPAIIKRKTWGGREAQRIELELQQGTMTIEQAKIELDAALNPSNPIPARAQGSPQEVTAGGATVTRS